MCIAHVSVLFKKLLFNTVKIYSIVIGISTISNRCLVAIVQQSLQRLSAGSNVPEIIFQTLPEEFGI